MRAYIRSNLSLFLSERFVSCWGFEWSCAGQALVLPEVKLLDMMLLLLCFGGCAILVLLLLREVKGKDRESEVIDRINGR